MAKEFVNAHLAQPKGWVGTYLLVLVASSLLACSPEPESKPAPSTSTESAAAVPASDPPPESAATAKAPESWPNSRVDNLNTGISPSPTGPLKAKRRWDWQALDRLSHTPVAADGVLYIGDWSPAFYAVSLTTGEQLWRSRPQTVKNDNRELPKEGESLVEAAMAQEVDDRYEFSAPVIFRDLVIAATQNGIVTAFRREDGSVAWERDLGADIYSSLRVSGERLLFGDDAGVFHGLQAETGADLFSYRTADTIGSTCAILSDGTAIFPAHDRQLHFVDTTTGNAKQVVDIKFRSTGTPLVAFGCLYFFHSGAKLIAYDLVDGRVRWEQAGNQVTSHGLARAGNLIVAHAGNELRAFDGVSGDIAWRLRLKAAGAMAAAVGPELIYATDGEGYIHAVNPQTGLAVWTDRFDESAASGPILVDGVLICIGGTGKLIAYD